MSVEIGRHVSVSELCNFMTGRVTRKEFVVPEAIRFGNGKRLKVTVNAELADEAPGNDGPAQNNNQ